MLAVALFIIIPLLISFAFLEWWPVEWSTKMNVGGWLYPEKEKDEE